MKKYISVFLTVLALAVAVYACTGLSQAKQWYEDRIFGLNLRIAALEEALDRVTDRLLALEAQQSPWEWTLEAAPWEDRTGADVTLIAKPETHQQGTAATLIVRRGGETILQAPCTWELASFRVTVSLDAADGYGYYLRLDRPDGSNQELTLATPEAPVPDLCVNLAGNLSAYCTLRINTWEESDGNLLLTSAHAHVQLPRLGMENAEIADAALVLTYNGAELTRTGITLATSEVAGSYDLTITDSSFSLPQAENDDLMELRLVVTLADGTELTAYGASWYRNDGSWYAMMG